MATATIDHNIAELADLFRLLGDTTRLRILLSCLDEPITVSDIANKLNLSQPLVSHHLRLLRATRIVKANRHGRQMFYVAADQHISCMLSNLLEHIDEPYPEAD